MPKFLDRPSWYESGGTQVYGVGVTNSASTYGDGAIPVYRTAAGGFTTISPTINGLHFTDINAWYAPVSKPSSNFALCYWTPNSRPEWLNTGTDGTLLKSSRGTPSWSGLYVHHINVSYDYGGYCFDIFFDLFAFGSTQYTVSNIIGKLPSNHIPATGHYWQTSTSGNAFKDGVVTNIYRASGGAGTLAVYGFRASDGSTCGTRVSSLSANGTLTDTVQTIS